MSIPNFDHRLNAPVDASPVEDESTFPCACGDPDCVGYYSDGPALIKIGKAWYASECPMGNQLDQIVSGRVAEARRDERRDDR